jgi:hypothetical protein
LIDRNAKAARKKIAIFEILFTELPKDHASSRRQGTKFRGVVTGWESIGSRLAVTAETGSGFSSLIVND